MKFSYNWLKDLVTDLDTEPAEIERLITIHTAECEGIEQVGNDRRVAEFESYLSQVTSALHAFIQAAQALPAAVRDDLDDAGLGPVGFAALMEDPRLSSTPRPPRRRQLRSFLERLRAKATAAVDALDRQSERGYR